MKYFRRARRISGVAVCFWVIRPPLRIKWQVEGHEFEGYDLVGVVREIRKMIGLRRLFRSAVIEYVIHSELVEQELPGHSILDDLQGRR